jgi:hypothetical protein
MADSGILALVSASSRSPNGAHDLVITVDTSVAHLAGALGLPVWTMLPHALDWRWLRDREDTPWYPTMRPFRQTTPRVWTDVLDRIGSELSELKRQQRNSPAAH